MMKKGSLIMKSKKIKNIILILLQGMQVLKLQEIVSQVIITLMKQVKKRIVK